MYIFAIHLNIIFFDILHIHAKRPTIKPNSKANKDNKTVTPAPCRYDR